MSNPDTAQLNIEISASDATVEDIDRTTCQLPFELWELDVESAELTTFESAPTGTKGDPVKFEAKGLEFEGPPEDFQKQIEALEKGKKKK